MSRCHGGDLKGNSCRKSEKIEIACEKKVGMGSRITVRCGEAAQGDGIGM
jgi:hypothetical protein